MRQPGSLSVLVLIVTAFALGAVMTSCGSDDSEVATISRIFDPGKTLALADLQAIGFKKSKEYDVEGLTGADSAYYGFWGLDIYDRNDYEVRFFPSHSDAVKLGVTQADERIGEGAELDEETSSWPVGLKDARKCAGSLTYTGPQNCKTPKYWDYSIYANMILICSGGTVENARLLCDELLTNLEPI